MLKAVVAATAAVTIAGSSLAYAQRDERQDGGRRWQPTTEDMQAFQAARLAALRAGLTLNPEQEKHWPAFEQAMRDLQQLRLNRVTEFREMRRAGPRTADPAERMRQRATRLAENGAVLKRLADATEPLYQSLNEAQRRRFAILTRMQGPRGWWRGRDGDERGMPRGHRRTDAAPAPADGTQTFARKAIDGGGYTQTFVSKTVDGVVVGRVFGTKTVEGELAVGEAVLLTGKSLFSGKALEPVAFSGKVTAFEPGLFGRKLTAGEGAGFSRKIVINEPPMFGRKNLTSI